jgi:hypothetical protein
VSKLSAHAFRYAGIDEYWSVARSTGFRRVLDGLDEITMQKMRAALSERVRAGQRGDGIYLEAIALIAVADR